MKNILAVLAGVVAAIVTLTAIEMLSASIYPLPPNVDLKNPESMKSYLENLPSQAIIFLLAGYALSALVGGIVAAAVSKRPRQAVTVGIILTIANCINLFDIPHPLWLTIVTILIFIPFAYAGGKIISRNHKPLSQ